MLLGHAALHLLDGFVLVRLHPALHIDEDVAEGVHAVV